MVVSVLVQVFPEHTGTVSKGGVPQVCVCVCPSTVTVGTRVISCWEFGRTVPPLARSHCRLPPGAQPVTVNTLPGPVPSSLLM